ncbi:hypothetical protein [Novosphingobium aquae]|uniref:FecR protein domain-containing protein n=1 Tax=Novosphingobium aquae TaxID=3133435 RepID=A0ABU8S982_9SPHN
MIVSPGGSGGAILGSYDVFGTNAGAETLTVYDNTVAVFQGDFARGGDTIRLTDAAGDFTVRIAGSNAELISLSDGIVVTVPIGAAGVSINFQTASNVYADARTLKFDGTNVVLGTQVLTTTATALDAYAPPQGALGFGFVGEALEIVEAGSELFDDANPKAEPISSLDLQPANDVGVDFNVGSSSFVVFQDVGTFA